MVLRLRGAKALAMSFRLGGPGSRLTKLLPWGGSVGCIPQDFDVPGGSNDPEGPQIVVTDVRVVRGDQVDGATCTGLPLGVENDPVAPSYQGDRVLPHRSLTPNVGYFQFRVGSVLDSSLKNAFSLRFPEIENVIAVDIFVDNISAGAGLEDDDDLVTILDGGAPGHLQVAKYSAGRNTDFGFLQPV